MPLLANSLPSFQQLAGLGAVLLAAGFMTLLGATAGRVGRIPEADLICGWGLSIAAVVVLAGFVAMTLTPVSAILLAGALLSGAVAWRRDRLPLAETGRLLALALPMLLIVTAMSASQWDEFSQWLHSTLFLVQTDALPRAGRSNTGASYTAYPYGMAVAGYLAARIAGGFVENAGALFNATLLVALASLIVRLVAETTGSGRGWQLSAASLLGVTLLSPTFVQKIAFTGYADSATAVATAFAGVLGWACLGAIAEDDASRARTLALRCGLALLAVVSLKQGNAGLVAAVVLGIAVAAAADPQVPFLRALRLSPLAFGPPLAMWAAWETYVAWQIPGTGFQSVEPDLSLVPEVLASMLDVALHKGGFFGLMLVICGLAAKALWRCRSELDRLALVTATAFLAYMLFLLWAYIYHFDPYEAVRAASFWRYSTHLGGLALAVAALAIGRWWHRTGGWRPLIRLGPAAVIAALLLPVVFEPKLRFDRHPVKEQVRSIGRELARILPPGARLLVVDPLDPGFYSKVIDFELRLAGRDGIVGAIHGEQTPSSAVDTTVTRTRPTHIWLQSTTAAIERALDLTPPPGASHLYVLRNGQWTLQRSWPFSGYERPSDLK